MRRVALLSALCVLHGLGCATMFNGRTQQLRIATEPPDAVVRVDGVPVRDTHAPDLSRSHDHAVAIEASGFRPETVTLDRHLSGLFWLNFLWGCAFPVGMIVDCSTGAMWNLQPDAVNVVLHPEGDRP